MNDREAFQIQNSIAAMTKGAYVILALAALVVGAALYGALYFKLF